FHTVFHLLGIPGLEDQHMWISIPFFFSYVIPLSGNSLLIFIIVTKHSPHEPMYLFHALAIFWFCAGDISLNRCITHFFITHSTFMSESGTLLVWHLTATLPYASTHYPLLTHTLVGKIGVTIFLRSYCMIFPMIFLLKRLTLCQSNIIPDTCCEHIGLAKYACNDIRVNMWYELFVIMSTVVLDVLLIFVSYTLILHAVFHVPSQDACHKALNMCGSHVCIIILFYGPAIITTLTQQFGSQVPPHIHISLDNVRILAPPMLNPITYGIKIEQIREQVAHIFFPMQK
uniref:Olfactory receptor family 52 subfamily B member 4 n=1 Tax=Monodon monoceros TaxID=40151 RepID=A0A8C6CDQ8_MONMO